MRVREGPRKKEFDGMKCKIPPFLGESKPDSYLDWEMKIEQIFECFDFNERIKVKPDSYQVLYGIRRMRRLIVETLAKLNGDLKEKFVPSYYVINLYNKLQRLYQGSKSSITSQCSNRRIMVLKENGKVESESLQEESSSSSEVESSSEESYYERDLLMVRRLMSNLVGEEIEI
ncbi:hypothetical protein CR513_06782, partial [Mucuna pruriens]